MTAAWRSNVLGRGWGGCHGGHIDGARDPLERDLPSVTGDERTADVLTS